MLAHHPVSIDGKQCQLEILSDTVLDYKERSETRVYGGSDSRGNVGGGSTVSLNVDIWLEQYQTNAELHGTYSKSLGMRPGNIFHQITLIGLCKEPLVIAIYNSSTREFVELWQNNSAWDLAFKKPLFKSLALAGHLNGGFCFVFCRVDTRHRIPAFAGWR